MDIRNLHKGVFVRQVLRGQRKVRLSFVPDDTSKEIESEVDTNATAQKKLWKRFLGREAGADLDIDTGVLVVRFKRDRSGGTAYFISSADSSKPITNRFEAGQSSGGITITPEDFYQCMADNAELSALGALNKCGSQFFSS